jgi:hypothetical protein
VPAFSDASSRKFEESEEFEKGEDAAERVRDVR